MLKRYIFIFIFSTTLSTSAASSSRPTDSLCPLCNLVSRHDQATLWHINNECLIANPKLASISEQSTNHNIKVVNSTLSALQKYVFGIMHTPGVNILTPQHQEAQNVVESKINAILKEINMPPFCKNRATEILDIMKELVAKAESKAGGEKMFPDTIIILP